MERDDEGVVEGLSGEGCVVSAGVAEAEAAAVAVAAAARTSITCFSRMIHLVRVCGFDASSFFLLTILRA